MIDPMQAFLEANAMHSPTYPPGSRYHAIGARTLTLPDGRMVAYLARRFVPAPERHALVEAHAVVEGDRIDNLADRYLGDAQQYWRIADANGAMLPADLTAQAGRWLRITLPEGIPGPADD